MTLWASKTSGSPENWIPASVSTGIELLPLSLELLPGVPDLADHEVAGRTEADVVVDAVWRKP